MLLIVLATRAVAAPVADARDDASHGFDIDDDDDDDETAQVPSDPYDRRAAPEVYAPTPHHLDVAHHDGFSHRIELSIGWRRHLDEPVRRAGQLGSGPRIERGDELWLLVDWSL
ncbi:MAG: hypothetical protein AB7R00_29425 [Kofleriaceae bacterium]